MRACAIYAVYYYTIIAQNENIMQIEEHFYIDNKSVQKKYIKNFQCAPAHKIQTCTMPPAATHGERCQAFTNISNGQIHVNLDQLAEAVARTG